MKLNNQKGSIPLLLLLIGIGLIAFFLVSSTFNFKNKIFEAFFPKPPSEAATSVESVNCGYGTFKSVQSPNGVFPTFCWRPYVDNSPFNQQIPSSPKLYNNSSAIVSRVFASAPDAIQVGHADTTSDFNHPIYFSQQSDPIYTINCVDYGGNCEIQGVKIHIPSKARPAGGSDHHMAVIDQTSTSNTEYDFFDVKVNTLPVGGGTLNIGFGGKTEILGDGLNSDATASWFGLAAGNIRAYEWNAGTIDHALSIIYVCDNGQIVYPAGGHGFKCSDTTNAPPLGARFYLDMSDSDINALPSSTVPAWKKTVLKAMAHYGMYFIDTGGVSGWGIKTESGSTYTSFGYDDPFIAFAQKVGAAKYGNEYGYFIDMSGIDYASKVKMIDPCVTQTGLANCSSPNPSSSSPVVHLIKPASSSTTSVSRGTEYKFTFQATATSNANISKVSYVLGSLTLCTATSKDTSGYYSCSATYTVPTTQATGTYALYAKAYDTSNNVGQDVAYILVQ